MGTHNVTKRTNERKHRVGTHNLAKRTNERKHRVGTHNVTKRTNERKHRVGTHNVAKRTNERKHTFRDPSFHYYIDILGIVSGFGPMIKKFGSWTNEY